jgi:hypothetical protein
MSPACGQRGQRSHRSACAIGNARPRRSNPATLRTGVGDYFAGSNSGVVGQDVAMSATWSRSSRRPPPVPGVTPPQRGVIVGVGPPSASARLQRRPLLPRRRRAGANAQFPGLGYQVRTVARPVSIAPAFRLSKLLRGSRINARGQSPEICCGLGGTTRVNRPSSRAPPIDPLFELRANRPKRRGFQAFATLEMASCAVDRR